MCLFTGILGISHSSASLGRIHNRYAVGNDLIFLHIFYIFSRLGDRIDLIPFLLSQASRDTGLDNRLFQEL